MRSLCSCLAAIWVAVAPGAARACDLALALAVDVSGSVDHEEYRLQMDGLAQALRDPVISEALVRARARLMLVQWTGASRQRVTIPWTAMENFDDVDALADRVASDPRVWRNYSTAIGEALSHTMAAFSQVAECDRHLIDLSGDGISNEGVPPAGLHPALLAAGITVNALAIEASEPDLTAYFFENVITGEGAFVVTAADFRDYPARIRRKLMREVTRASAGLRP